MNKRYKSSMARKNLRVLKTLRFVSAHGKIFSVLFRKAPKDGVPGELRTMRCRTGVTKYLKGGKNTSSHLPWNFTVEEFGKKRYRTVPVQRTLRIRGGGVEYNF